MFPPRFVLLSIAVVAAILLAAITTTVRGNAVLTVKTCTDTILCRSETCSTKYNIPTEMCIPAGNSSSKPVQQVLLCDPNVNALGVLFYYSDKFCTVPVNSEAFPCNECVGQKKQRVQCLSKNGVESVQVDSCDTEKCNNKCTPVLNVPAGQCVPALHKQTNQMQYVKFEGAFLGNMVDQFVWPGETCQDQFAGFQQFPAERCIDGMEFLCHFDHDNATVAKQKAARACPRADNTLVSSSSSSKIACAKSIAVCRDVCKKGDNKEACKACISGATLSNADAKQCCRTLSYYLQFPCDHCTE